MDEAVKPVIDFLAFEVCPKAVTSPDSLTNITSLETARCGTYQADSVVSDWSIHFSSDSRCWPL